MTIINIPSDGLYPELIVIFRLVASLGEAEKNTIIEICSRGSTSSESNTRLRGALLRWTNLGLFSEESKVLKINENFNRGKRESLDDYTARLPSFCRTLVFEGQNCHPLWGNSPGISADFVRGSAWLLAQNIYGFPSARSGVEPIEVAQMGEDSAIFTNDVRWNGIRFWMRYLGFATGDSSSFQIDPTLAVKGELKSIFKSPSAIPARDFLDSLAIRLPILDFGGHRKEVEDSLNSARWRKPDQGHISMSLSLALRRLVLDNVIRLEGKADTGSSYRLTGMNYRTWGGFESVSWIGEKP